MNYKYSSHQLIYLKSSQLGPMTRNNFISLKIKSSSSMSKIPKSQAVSTKRREIFRSVQNIHKINNKIKNLKIRWSHKID